QSGQRGREYGQQPSGVSLYGCTSCYGREGPREGSEVMTSMAKPSASEIKANIQSQDAAVWNQASARPEGLDKLESDLAAAIAAAWSDVESGLAISSITVTGGTSPPN